MDNVNKVTESALLELTGQSLEGMFYHSYRAAFYDKVDKIVSALILLSGTAEYYKFVEGKWLDPYLKLIFVVLAIAQLTLVFSRKLSLHETLKTKYADLQSKFKNLSHESDEKVKFIKFSIYREELSSILKDEPKAMMALRAVARNRVVNSLYIGEQLEQLVIPLKNYHNILAQFWAFDTLSLKTNADQIAIMQKEYDDRFKFMAKEQVLKTIEDLKKQ